MKKLVYSIAAMIAMLCTACEHYDHAIADQTDRLDILEKSTIKNIDEQVTAINTSIEDLEDVDTSLKTLIDGLSAKASDLQLKLDANTNADAETKRELQGEISNINELITSLQGKDTELDQKIADLKTYVNSELAETEDWAEATFATLEQYNAVQTEISGIKTLIETYKTEITSEYTTAISTAITDVETSMKTWVNTEFAANYYEISEIDALLSALETKIGNSDEALKQAIEDHKTDLNNLSSSLTEAYKTAIQEAITNNNGQISQDIADAVNAATTDIKTAISAINTDIETIKQAILAINTSITTIKDQIAAINTSIEDLEDVDTSLKTLIDDLSAKATDLQSKLDANTNADAETKRELQGEITNINTLIESLQNKDTKLDQKITDLKTYVDSELAETEDWAEATFATLEQYKEMQDEISDIKNLIETYKTDITNAYTTAISNAITDVETSMKTWVNTEFAAIYYEISEIDALLSALETKIGNSDEALKQAIEDHKTDLNNLSSSLTEAYKTAIQDAITNNNGQISQDIADAVSAAVAEFNTAIATINTDIEAMKNRLGVLEDTVEDLVARIQSIRFLPEYSDGKVELNDETTLTFILSPKDAAVAIADAAANNPEVVTAFIVRTKVRTKAVDMPTALTVKSVAGNAEGMLEVVVSNSDLPDDFWINSQNANIYICISDGNNDIISELIPTCTVVNKYFAVNSQAAAQAALDNALDGAIIKLAPGVNYGTLYMRPVAGSAQTKVVDWIGNNYKFETYSCFENLTIIGAEGATVDAIEIEGGTYYYSEHSQSDKYPVMLSLIELKNVVIDGVTFTGNGGYDPQGYGNAINLSGENIKVDGLTLKNCVLSNSENNARLLYKTESTTRVHNYDYNGETFTFSPTLKDITITDCTFNGGYMGLELRETENITITNNEFNVADRNILLPANTNCTYTGQIIITGNVSNNAKQRFVRADGTGDAEVVITNNTLNNYIADDADYIKVSNGNNVTIQDNNLCVSTSAGLQNAMKVGGEIKLINDITLTESSYIKNANFVLDGNGKTIYQDAQCTFDYALIDTYGVGNIVIKDLTFDGIKGGAVLRTAGGVLTMDNVVVQNCEHTKPIYGMFRLIGKNVIKNSTFIDNQCISVITFNTEGDGNTDPQLVQNCEFSRNTCSTTAVVHYSTGGGITLDGNKFLSNKVTTTNGATVYLGFKKNCTVTNNVFKENIVTATSKRSSGGLMVGNNAIVTGNAFVDNIVTVNGETGYGNNVCASVYYSSIDLSGNYWGGGAPVLGDDYYQEYNNNTVIINDYLTTYNGL